MEFVRSFFFTNETLGSCHFFHQNKIVIKTITQCKKKCLSNVLISGESNFDEINGQLIRGS